MSETVTAVCNYCVSELNYGNLTCGYFEGNEQSKHMMECCDFSWLKDIDTVVNQDKTVLGKLYVSYNLDKCGR